jgi:hypothetical protein
MAITRIITPSITGLTIPNTSINNASLNSVTALPSGVNVSTPAFEAKLSSTQSVNNNTLTKVAYATENFDTDNCYDHSSNYRFTPNVAGKYFVYAQLYVDAAAAANFNEGNVVIRKNGNTIIDGLKNMSNNPPKGMALPVSGVLDMNGSSDYVEIWGSCGDASGNPQFLSGAYSVFGAYKLIT